MRITQVELFDDLGTKMVCWVPTDGFKLKEAMKISLKGDDRVWRIGEVYGTQDHHEINRRWGVGGL